MPSYYWIAFLIYLIIVIFILWQTHLDVKQTWASVKECKKNDKE